MSSARGEVMDTWLDMGYESLEISLRRQDRWIYDTHIHSSSPMQTHITTF